MAERRRPVDMLDQTALTQRIATRLDEGLGAISERVEVGFDRVNARIDGLERDSDRNAIDRASLSALRDEVSALRASIATPAAAPAPVAVSPAAPWKASMKTVLAILAGFTLTVTAGANVPKAARVFEDFWVYLLREPEAPAPEKDETGGR